MTDTRKEFEAWLLKEHLLNGTWNESRNCYDEYPCHLAYKSWQACQRINDKRIALLNEAITEDKIFIAMMDEKEKLIAALEAQLAESRKDVEIRQHVIEAKDACLRSISRYGQSKAQIDLMIDDALAIDVQSQQAMLSAAQKGNT